MKNGDQRRPMGPRGMGRSLRFLRTVVGHLMDDVEAGSDCPLDGDAATGRGRDAQLQMPVLRVDGRRRRGRNEVLALDRRRGRTRRAGAAVEVGVDELVEHGLDVDAAPLDRRIPERVVVRLQALEQPVQAAHALQRVVGQTELNITMHRKHNFVTELALLGSIFLLLVRARVCLTVFV